MGGNAHQRDDGRRHRQELDADLRADGVPALQQHGGPDEEQVQGGLKREPVWWPRCRVHLVRKEQVVDAGIEAEEVSAQADQAEEGSRSRAGVSGPCDRARHSALRGEPECDAEEHEPEGRRRAHGCLARGKALEPGDVQPPPCQRAEADDDDRAPGDARYPGGVQERRLRLPPTSMLCILK